MMFSIVTPSYQQGRFIEATIRSVLSQEGVEVEYGVFDGGSTDGTVEILKRYGDRLRWRSGPDRGQAHAINLGLREAHGEWLAYLNSDDVYEAGVLARVAAAARANPGADLIYGDCWFLDEATGVKTRHPSHPCTWRDLVLGGNVIGQPAGFFSRAAYARLGGFDEALRYAFDYDFWIRLLKTGLAVYLPEPLATFRLHPGSKTSAEMHPFSREVLTVSHRHGGRLLSPLALRYLAWRTGFDRVAGRWPWLWRRGRALLRETFRLTPIGGRP